MSLSWNLVRSVLFVIFAYAVTCPAQLMVKFGPAGLQKLTHGGTVLEDTAAYPADNFRIGHMKVTDLQGHVIAADGWGETNLGRKWEPESRTWIYNFPWGTIRCRFVQVGNRLDVVVTETNQKNSGVMLAGASVFALTLHFPVLPQGFDKSNYPQIETNTTGPSVISADFGAGLVASVMPEASKPLYTGLWPAGGASPAYAVLLSSTSPDGLAVFKPHFDRPVGPGQTDVFTLSLRFAQAGTPLASLAADAFRNWSVAWPPRLKWTDRRIIGTSYLASASSGHDITHPAGYPSNPRRYFNVSDPGEFDVRTSDGLARFQTRLMGHAADVAINLKRLNAQGLITWDLEGQEYPQNTSYVCSPDQIATAAPEMESVIKDQASPYRGMKLDDAYFKLLRTAGFRIGVCVRPQRFVRAANGTAQQVVLDEKSAEAELLRKIRYAHDRWGATLFYLDSSVRSNGIPLDPGVLQRLSAAFPDSLLVPEESVPRDYAYSAPFQSFLFHRDLGTDRTTYAFYPHAFSCNLVNDVDANALAGAATQLVKSVAAGDVLMTTADYWQSNNSVIVSIYQRAAELSKHSAR